MKVRNSMQNTSENLGSKKIHMSVPHASEATPIAGAEIEQRIRARAYELYVERGMQDGFAELDWLQAEAEILSKTAMKAAA